MGVQRCAADSFSDDTSLDASNAAQVGGRAEYIGKLWLLPGKEIFNEENVGKCDLFPSFLKTLCVRH